MKTTCQSLKFDIFDSINIALKHSILPENIVGQIPELDNNTVHEQYGELGRLYYFFTYIQTKNDPTNFGIVGGAQSLRTWKSTKWLKRSSLYASHGIWRSLGNPDPILLPEFAGSTGKCLPARVDVFRDASSMAKDELTQKERGL